MRTRYQALLQDPAALEAILLAGAVKARALALPFMRELRQAVGLRPLASRPAPAARQKSTKATLPVFKQYLEADGRFHFKLLDAQGGLLLQSLGFDSPRDAAQAVELLQTQGAAALAGMLTSLEPMSDATSGALAAALAQLSARESETDS